ELLDNHNLGNLKGEQDFTFSLSNFINYDRNYVMIALIDYKQSPIKIRDETKTYHIFNAKKNETKNISFGIEIPNKTNELTLLIFKDPNKVETNLENTDRLTSLQVVLTLRYKLNNDNDNDINVNATMNSVETNKNLPLDNVFVSSDKSKLKITPKSKIKEPLYVIAGNEFKNNTMNALIAFNNWEQTTINNNKVNYIETDKHMKIYELDELDEGLFQFVLLPKPFNVSNSDYESLAGFGSFRFTSEK